MKSEEIESCGQEGSHFMLSTKAEKELAESGPLVLRATVSCLNCGKEVAASRPFCGDTVTISVE